MEKKLKKSTTNEPIVNCMKGQSQQNIIEKPSVEKEINENSQNEEKKTSSSKKRAASREVARKKATNFLGDSIFS